MPLKRYNRRYDSEGNTLLISDGSKISAIYQDRTIDLWAYVEEEEGFADNMVAWETEKKNFLRGDIEASHVLELVCRSDR